MKGLFSRLKRNKNTELDYESILMDSMNLPRFDQGRMEGSIERSITREAFVAMIAVFGVIMAVYVLQLTHVQIFRGVEFANIAENNRLNSQIIFNKRGIIYDRYGRELAWNIESSDRDFPIRRYWEEPGLAHLLGYVSYPAQDSNGNYFNTQYRGISGLEHTFSERLNGTMGRNVREVDALGREISFFALEAPVPGENIYLSIDAQIQSQMNKLLTEYINANNFVGAAAVIMDVDTGELLLSTSVPEYDSNILSDGQDRTTIASYNTDDSLPFLNRAMGGVFTPGSVVKIFVAAGILEEDVVDPRYELHTDGTFEVEHMYGSGSTIFRDARNNGLVDLYRAIARSSNIYFMVFGGGSQEHVGLGINRMVKYFNRFGLGEKTGIRELREFAGNVPSPEWKRSTFNEGWLLADTYFTAIGQYAFLATPLQLVVGTAAIANGGEVLVPTLERDKESVVRKYTGLSTGALAGVRHAMRQAVTQGTARNIDLPFVEVSAKTGTAERGVRNNRVNSWTVGFWPSSEPRYAFAIMAEQGPSYFNVPISSVMAKWLRWIDEESITGYW